MHRRRLCLHFGAYEIVAVRWLYLLLGFGGALLLHGGNLLWIESRRKGWQPTQKPAHRAMSRATLGVCSGVRSAIGCVPGRQVSPRSGTSLRTELAACLITRATCTACAFLRAPIHAALELLWLAAGLTVQIPLAHGMATGCWFWQNLSPVRLARTMVNVGTLAMTVGLASLARVAGRRGSDGASNSVWSGDALAR